MTYGIIPAYAGNTIEVFDSGNPDRDHPRICGEHCATAFTMFSVSGSSPHMRGTLTCLEITQAKHGIIPAYAGNTVLQELGL